jgi:hypothetical protein
VLRLIQPPEKPSFLRVDRRIFSAILGGVNSQLEGQNMTAYQVKIAYARAVEASNLAHGIWAIAAKWKDSAEWAAVAEIAGKAVEAADDAEGRLRELLEGDDLAAMEVEAPLQ